MHAPPHWPNMVQERMGSSSCTYGSLWFLGVEKPSSRYRLATFTCLELPSRSQRGPRLFSVICPQKIQESRTHWQFQHTSVITSQRRAKQCCCEFKAVLGYIVSSVLARAINLTSKKKGGKKIKTTPFQKKKKNPQAYQSFPFSFLFLLGHVCSLCAGTRDCADVHAHACGNRGQPQMFLLGHCFLSFSF